MASVFQRSKINAEMEEELRSHIQHRADDLERSGLSRAEAERHARIEFGGQERFKEECREALGTHFLGTFLNDVRYGLRMLRRSPGFTAIAVLTFAIGIGVNTSIFSLIYALAIRPLPLKDASSLVSIYQESRATKQHPRGTEGAPSYVSYPEYANYRDGNHAFFGLAAYAEITLSFSGRDPEFLHGLLASCNYFDVLGAKLAAGRGFGPSDCRPSAAGSVVVLSNGFWQRKFGGDPSVIGKRLTLNSQVFDVIGVTAPEFSGTELQVPDLWLPISMASQLMPNTFGTRDWLALPNVSWLQVVGLVKPGISRRQAQAEVNILAHQMDANSPGAKTTVTVNAAAFLNSPVETCPVCVANPDSSQFVGHWRPLETPIGNPLVHRASPESCHPPISASATPWASDPRDEVRAAEFGTCSPSLGCHSLRHSAEIGLFVFLRDKSTRALLHVAFHKKGRSAIRKLYIWHPGLTVQRCPGTRRFWADGRQLLPYRITEGLPVTRPESALRGLHSRFR